PLARCRLALATFVGAGGHPLFKEARTRRTALVHPLLEAHGSYKRRGHGGQFGGYPKPKPRKYLRLTGRELHPVTNPETLLARNFRENLKIAQTFLTAPSSLQYHPQICNSLDALSASALPVSIAGGFLAL